jgi:hypothetical protein
MTEVPGIIVPPDAGLDEVLEEIGTTEPLMAFTQSFDDQPEGEDWSGAIDALIAAGLFEM